MKDKGPSSHLQAPVRSVLTSSWVDGPGNRAAIFLQGCNYNCLYCHNPETIDPDSLADCRGLLSPEDLLDQLADCRPFIRGLTLSGGECMGHPAFVAAVCQGAKEWFGPDFSCLLDSNGSLPFDGVLPYVDGVLLDVKASDEKRHLALTGAPLAPVLGNLTLLAEQGKLAEVRTVIFKDAREGEACIRLVANLLSQASPGALPVAYRLIRYRPRGVRPAYLRQLQVPGGDTMEALACLATSLGFEPVVVI